MWPFNSNTVSGQIINGQVNGMGAMSQPMSLGTPTAPAQNPSPQPQNNTGMNRVLSDPSLMNAIGRMGSAMLVANEKGMGFGGALGYGTNAFQDEIARQEKTALEQQLTQAKIAEAQKAGKYGIQSGGFEGDIARARFILSSPSASPEEKAQAQAVMETAQRMQGGYDPVSGEYRWNPRTRFGGDVASPATASDVGMGIQQPTMQSPVDGLLPPPASSGTPDTFMFGGAPVSANRKNQAALEKMTQEPVAKAQGEAAALYQSMQAKMPQLESTVNRLDALANTANYAGTDILADVVRKQLKQPVSSGAADAAEYISTVRNQILPLLRDTFGPQFTAAEGQKLEDTLGDVNMAPAEKQAVLRSFIRQKQADMVVAARQAGIPIEQGPKVLRYNPATGRLE